MITSMYVANKLFHFMLTQFIVQDVLTIAFHGCAMGYRLPLKGPFRGLWDAFQKGEMGFMDHTFTSLPIMMDGM